MITTDSNVLFEDVLYNDIEIDLLLRTYGAEQSILEKEKIMIIIFYLTVRYNIWNYFLNHKTNMMIQNAS